MTYADKLNQLRKQWLAASKEDRVVIEIRAKLLKWAIEKMEQLSPYQAAKKIFK